MATAGSSDYVTVQEQIVSGISEYEADATTIRAFRDVVLKIKILAYGNSGLIRYRSGENQDGPWRYCALCSINLVAELAVTGYTGGIVTAADGTHDLDVNVIVDFGEATAKTLIAFDGVLSKDTSIASGSVVFAEGYGMTPDMTLYTASTADVPDSLFRVPWTYNNDPEADITPAVSQFSNLVVTFSDFEGAAIPPDL